MKTLYLALLSLLIFTSTTFAQGVWTQKANFIGPARSRGVRFTINNQIYFGSGNINNGNPESDDFYKYDIITDSWTQIASLPKGMQAGIGFSINGKGYAGIGWLNGYGFKDFYEYDPISNSWTTRTSWPGPYTNDANSFVINGKGYVGGGDGPYGNPTISDFYEFNPTSNSWSQKANIPSPGRRGSGTFTIGNFGYLGGGSNDDLHQAFIDYYKYDPIQNLWTSIANFPTGPTESRNCGFNLNGAGYATYQNFLNQIFKYDTTLNVWTPITVPSNINFDADMAQELNGKVYFIRYSSNEFWEWSPCTNDSSEVHASICQGESYTLGDNQIVNTAGSYITTLHKQSGCDSIITTNLIVNPTYNRTVNASICQGESYTLPDGQIVITAGNYSTSLHTNLGCDSIIITNLTINSRYNILINANICQGSTYALPDGQNVSSAGNYITTLHSIFGCDSVINTNLRINTTYNSSVNASFCQGQSYTLPNGQIVTSPNDYTTILHSVANCDSIIITHLVSSVCGPNSHCTYSQGFYGNSNGIACSGQAKIQLINSLLSTNLIIGAGLRTITFANGDAQCIINKLPATNSPAKLPLGNVACGNVSGIKYLNSQGRFNNILLGQTLTLGLNMRYDNTLGSLLLNNSNFVTSAATNCGTGTIVPNSNRSFRIPNSVLTYLGSNNSVANLFVLANNALAGIYIASGGNPSLSDINNAIDAINRGFDGCRAFGGSTITSPRLASTETNIDSKQTNLIAYPNPFSNTITIHSGSSSNNYKTIVIRDISGRTVKLIEGVSNDVIMGNDFAPGIYFVEVIQGDSHQSIQILKIGE